MTTKYILVGGYPHKAIDGGKAFAEALVAGFEQPVKILDCLFARPVENWDKAYNKLKNYKEDLPILTLAEGQFEIRGEIKQYAENTYCKSW